MHACVVHTFSNAFILSSVDLSYGVYPSLFRASMSAPALSNSAAVVQQPCNTCVYVCVCTYVLMSAPALSSSAAVVQQACNTRTYIHICMYEYVEHEHELNSCFRHFDANKHKYSFTCVHVCTHTHTHTHSSYTCVHVCTFTYTQ